MTQTRITPSWQSAIIVLSGAVVGLIIVIGLQWGRPVLVPIALAILLTFLLNPVVDLLRKRGLGRMPAVMLAVSAAGLTMLLIGGLVTRQVIMIVAELPQNTANIKARVRTLRQLGSSRMATQFEKMAEEISEATILPAAGERTPHGAPGEDGLTGEKIFPEKWASSGPVITRMESTPWLWLTGYLSSAFEVLATFAFSLILLVFLLLGREDLRDRIVLLAGKTRLTFTSRALKDITDRISRYIIMVALLNGGFGAFLTAGLLLLQVPHALMWGLLSGMLRFIPYIGPWFGAVFPIAMSLATSEGWAQPLAVFGYVVVLELTCNNVIEPLVFRRSTGISPTALLISAAFWLYLWGPIGLVFSAPITVCLVVLGQNIPQLGFLKMLLGDTPALRASAGLYQRLMLGDEHEADGLILERMKAVSAEEVFDEMLVPALNFTRRDVQRGHSSDEDQRMVLEGMRNVLRHTDEFLRTKGASLKPMQELAPDEQNVHFPEENSRVRILGCPATDDTDRVGLEILRQLLDPAHWELELISVETLTSELVVRIVENPPAILCIASLPPGGMSHARYLCKRLRAAAPEMPIIVGRWGRQRSSKLDSERLELAGASFVTTTLMETVKLLKSRLPLLTRVRPTVIVSAFPEQVCQLMPGP